ncbi:MAG: SPOR domain-containing protein [Chitinophagales bacterium]|nr:SPOR domain-containing protein [Chitinophagales bacterium]
MIQIENHIFELLWKNNCIILPGFGGFVCNKKASKIIDGELIAPPTKTISFNKNLIANDGLLYHFVAQKMDLTYNMAEEACRSFIQQIINRLNAGESIFFHQIGKLYFDAEKNLQFFPTMVENFALSSYGLKKIKLHAINRNIVPEAIKPVDFFEEILIEKPVMIQERTERVVKSEPLEYRESYTETPKIAAETIQESAPTETLRVETEEVEEVEGKSWFGRIAAGLVIMMLGGLVFFIMNHEESRKNIELQTSTLWTNVSKIFAPEYIPRERVQLPEKKVETSSPTVTVSEENVEVSVVNPLEESAEVIAQSPQTTETTAPESDAKNPFIISPAEPKAANTPVKAAPVAESKASAVQTNSTSIKPVVNAVQVKTVSAPANPMIVTNNTKANTAPIQSNTLVPSSNKGQASLVFGSFKTNENAQRLIDKLKAEGIGASIQSGENGFKRVVFFTDPNNAQKIKDSHPGSWIKTPN